MPLITVLATLNAEFAQCDALIVSAHRQDVAGQFLFPARDREQITTAAFLNMFIAWEAFIEASLAQFMIGEPSIAGNLPTRFVSPISEAAANKMVIGHNAYFDYSSHDKLKKMVYIFFDQGLPYQPHLDSIAQEIADLKAIRNNCAHISSTTKQALARLAQRIFNTPKPNITSYELLIAADPGNPGSTVFKTYRDKLAIAAQLIATG